MPIGMSKNSWFNTSDSLTNIVKENLVLLLDAGNLSSYRVYNRALSLEEVEQNFNALRGRYGV